MHLELIIKGNIVRKKQLLPGSFHKITDKEPFQHLISDKGWGTLVESLIGKALIKS